MTLRNIPALAAAGLLLLTLSLSSCRQEPTFSETEEVGPYTVSLIQKDVWHVEDCNSTFPAGSSLKEDGTPQMNNCSDMYIVRGKDKAILIDLSNNVKWEDGADVALQKIFFDRSGDRQKLITITHNHGDHLGMMHAFKDNEQISFIVGKDDFGKSEAFPSERTSYLLEGDKIDLGGDMALETIEVPGHTPGSMVFYLKGHDIIFSGDAIGSGTGVWLFSEAGFGMYKEGVPHLLEFVQDPANGIDPSKLVFHPGHDWQSHGAVLDMQYLLDMDTLVKKMLKGEVEPEAYSAGFPYLNANFTYGSAVITWNAEDARAIVEE